MDLLDAVNLKLECLSDCLSAQNMILNYMSSEFYFTSDRAHLPICVGEPAFAEYSAKYTYSMIAFLRESMADEVNRVSDVGNDLARVWDLLSKPAA